MLEFARPLGDSVRDARQEQHLTQSKVAEQISIDARTIMNIENYSGNPKMEVLFPLLRELKIDPWYIFYPELENPSPAIRKLLILLKDCEEADIETLIPICQAVLENLQSKNGIVIE